MRRIRLFIVVCAAVLGLTGAGTCASASSRGPVPAPSPRLRIATWQRYLDPRRPDKPWAWQAFERATGAVLGAVGMGNSDDLIAAARSDTFDLIVAPSHLVPDLIGMNRLVPIPVSRLSHYASLQPNLQHVRYGLVDGVDYCVPYAWGPLALAYDKLACTQPPRSWRALWEPTWRGRVAHWDDMALLWTAALASGHPDCFHLEGHALWEAGRWAARLCAQGALLWRDETAQVVDMAAGRVALCAADPSAVARANRLSGRGGGTWALAYPEEGVTGFVDNYCVTTSCRDLKLALAFIDSACSPPVQAALSNFNACGPASAAAVRQISPARRAQLNLDDPNHLNRLILWRPVPNAADYARIMADARSGRLLQ